MFSSGTQHNKPVKTWTQTFRSRVQRTNQSARFKWVSKVMKDYFDWSKNFAPSPLPISRAAHLKPITTCPIAFSRALGSSLGFICGHHINSYFQFFCQRIFAWRGNFIFHAVLTVFWLFKHTVLTQAHVVAPSPWHYCKIIQSSQSLWWLQQSHDNWLQAVLESTQWWLEAMTLSVSSCEWAANGVDLAKLREPSNNFKKILVPQP